jgi:hypothetical protein
MRDLVETAVQLAVRGDREGIARFIELASRQPRVCPATLRYASAIRVMELGMYEAAAAFWRDEDGVCFDWEETEAGVPSGGRAARVLCEACIKLARGAAAAGETSGLVETLLADHLKRAL